MTKVSIEVIAITVKDFNDVVGYLDTQPICKEYGIQGGVREEEGVYGASVQIFGLDHSIDLICGLTSLEGYSPRNIYLGKVEKLEQEFWLHVGDRVLLSKNPEMKGVVIEIDEETIPSGGVTTCRVQWDGSFYYGEDTWTDELDRTID